MKKSIYLCVIYFCFTEVIYAGRITIEDMFNSAGLVVRVNVSTVSYRVGNDKCIRHHWGKVKEVYKGNNIIKGQVLDLGHTTYYSHYILDEYIVFIKENMHSEKKINFSSFEGVNVYENGYDDDCLKSIANSYRQLWNDPKGALRVTDRYRGKNGIEYFIQFPETVSLPNHIRRVQPEWDSNDIQDGWYWVKENELDAFLKSLKSKKIKGTER